VSVPTNSSIAVLLLLATDSNSFGTRWMLVENSGRLVDETSLLGLWNYELERMKRQKHSFE